VGLSLSQKLKEKPNSRANSVKQRLKRRKAVFFSGGVFFFAPPFSAQVESEKQSGRVPMVKTTVSILRAGAVASVFLPGIVNAEFKQEEISGDGTVKDTWNKGDKLPKWMEDLGVSSDPSAAARSDTGSSMGSGFADSGFADNFAESDFGRMGMGGSGSVSSSWSSSSSSSVSSSTDDKYNLVGYDCIRPSSLPPGYTGRIEDWGAKSTESPSTDPLPSKVECKAGYHPMPLLGIHTLCWPKMEHKDTGKIFTMNNSGALVEVHANTQQEYRIVGCISAQASSATASTTTTAGTVTSLVARSVVFLGFWASYYATNLL